MTSDEFEALLAKRDECQVSHDLACQILAEEGENALTRHTCLQTYFELEDVEQQIKSECYAEAERLAADRPFGCERCEDVGCPDCDQDYEPSPMCRCEQCGPRGPFTCIGGVDD